VPQLQVHLVTRRGDDAARSVPVWGTAPYDPAACGRFIAALRRKVELSWHPERLATPDKTR
jgi:hypothetical protein